MYVKLHTFFRTLPHVALLTAFLSIGMGGEAQNNNLVFDSSDFFYNIIDSAIPGVEVTYPNVLQSELWEGYEEPVGDVIFPATIRYRNVTYRVMEISPWTFAGCGKITSVTFTDELRGIGFSAFASCDGLQSVEIPASVKTIGGCAFYACRNLASVILPQRLQCIEPYTFAECTALSAIDIPASVSNIGSKAFLGCASLKRITLHSANPPEIDKDTFAQIPTDVVVYVPQGTADTYRKAKGWKQFQIVEGE